MYDRDDHARDENSVLFDLDALFAGDDTPGDQPAILPPTAVAIPGPLIPSPGRSRAVSILTTIAVVLAGGIALAAAGGVAWRMSIEETPADAMSEAIDPVIEAAPARIVIAATAPAPEVQTPPPEFGPPAPPAAPEAPAEPEAEETRQSGARPRPRPRRPRPRPTPRPEHETGARPEAAPAPTPQPVADPVMDEVGDILGVLDRDPTPPEVRHVTVTLPERLTRKQIVYVARKTGPKMRGCSGDGIYRVSLRILPGGQVQEADVRGADPAVAACVQRHALQMTFPRFGGDPMRLTLPFSL